MKKIIIVGAGGHAAEVREYINYYNKLNLEQTFVILGFLDVNNELHTKYNYPEPYLGTAENHTINFEAEYMFCFGNMMYKEKLVSNYREAGASFLTFIHPTALIAETCKIGEGVLVSHNASVGPMVTIGDFNILNSRCTIGHDAVIGNYNFISPQVSLSGNTSIGDYNMFGVNSATIPGVNLGNNNTIGAGSIITKNVIDNAVIVGVPGKKIRTKEA